MSKKADNRGKMDMGSEEAGAPSSKEKRCPDCGREKSFEEFPRSRNRADGRHTYCKPCHNARGRETRKRLYGDSRHYHLRGRYGIGAEEVSRLVRAQGGVCAICRDRPADQVDHEHATGKIRGILCGGCNAGLGAFGDSPEVITSAIAYLQRGYDSGAVREDSLPYRPDGLSGPPKTCPDCGQVKPSSGFPRNKNYRDGKHPYCKPCHIARGRETRERLYGGSRNYLLGLRYGISAEEVDRLISSQGGACAICRRRPPRHVDHDHVTGQVRGVLCFRCNRGLGQFLDNTEWLVRAVEYLKRWKGRPGGTVRETAASYIIAVA